MSTCKSLRQLLFEFLKDENKIIITILNNL